MKPEIEIFGPRPMRFNIDSLSVTQEEGMHDMFTSYLARPGAVDAEDLKGQPCQVTWGTGFSTTTLVGYVDTTSRIVGEQSGLVIIALGATSTMRSGEARSWRRASPFRIARNVVHPYRMSLVADKYIATVDAFMQTDDSDWACLARLAGLSGMSLVGRNTSVMLIDVRKAIGRAKMRPVPVFREPESFVQMETPSPVGFDTFDFSGIDRLGSKFAVRGGPEGGVQRHASQNFSSLDEARMASVKHGDRQRHHIRAVATFHGQLNMQVGDVCVVEGQHWYVAKCQHEVRIGTSQTTVTAELHRAVEGRPATADIALNPASVLRGGKWIAERNYEVEL